MAPRGDLRNHQRRRCSRDRAPHPDPARPVTVTARGAAIAGSALGLLVSLLAGCAPPNGADDWATVREITPAFLVGPAPGAAPAVRVQDPAVAADAHGRVALTWVTRDSAVADLWLSVSRDNGATFSTPAPVNIAAGRVVSSPEGRPAPTFGPGGALAVAWSESRGDTTGAVDLRVRASADGGYSLGPVVTVNDDTAGMPPGLGWRTARRWRRQHDPGAFHGLAALAFLPDGSLFATWLDGRHLPPPGGRARASSLFYASSFDGGQTWGMNVSASDSACPCCRPVALADDHGRVAVAFRRGPEAPSDPALMISLDGGRTFARDTVVSRDAWTPANCSQEGPGLTWNRAGGGHYAWITGGAGAGAYLMPWREASGAAGLRRALSDSITAAAHPRLAALGVTTLIGLEARPHADAAREVFAVRALDLDGSLTPWIFLGADVRSGWLAGANPRSAFATWIERDRGRDRVRVVRLTKQARR
jgi:hypothetical protein